MTNRNARDELEILDRIYLEKLRLAANVILALAEESGTIPDTLEAELYIFKDRVERALLLPSGAAESILPRHPPETT